MQTLAYGSWPSPIDAALAAAHDGRPEYVGFVGDEAWWTEPRPAEGGRRALVRRRADGTRGAGAARAVERAQPGHRVRRPALGRRRAADGGPLVVFAHFADQRLYALRARRARRRAAPAHPALRRWAADCAGRTRSCARTAARCGASWRSSPATGPPTCAGSLAAVPLDGSAAEDRDAVRELTDDRHRFVTGPRLSPDGAARRLARLGPSRACRGTARSSASPRSATTARFGGPRTVAGGPGGVRRPGRVGPRRPPAVRQRPHRLVEPATGRPDAAAPYRSARARRSSAGRCGSSASAGSPRWTAA